MAGPGVRLDLGPRGRLESERPLVMGILNVTPDSFSDGGRYFSPDAAVARAVRLVEEGADILDVGGESTRPGAEPVSPSEETRRVVPVIEALRAAGLEVPVSVDTRHTETARAALDAGADLVNDVSALADPEMGPLVRERGVAVVLMHMRGEPKGMQRGPSYEDVVQEVVGALADRARHAMDLGIPRERILLDPGLGFGKRTGSGTEDNCALLSGLPRLVALGHPVLVGASRKHFIGNLTGAPLDARLPGSVVAAAAAVWGGASVVRVHDVAETVQAVRLAAAIDPTEWTR